MEASFPPKSTALLNVDKREIKIFYDAYENGDIPDNYMELLNKAKQAAEKAYAPYSKFHVGAAVQLKETDGSTRIVKASN